MKRSKQEGRDGTVENAGGDGTAPLAKRRVAVSFLGEALSNTSIDEQLSAAIRGGASVERGEAILALRSATSKTKLRQQNVTDDRGRRRFHGAFTGGYSAGYFNTVATPEGWTPASYVSSLGDRRGSQHQQQRIEDFMDAEDLENISALAPSSLAASALVRRRNGDGNGVSTAPGAAAVRTMGAAARTGDPVEQWPQHRVLYEQESLGHGGGATSITPLVKNTLEATVTAPVSALAHGSFARGFKILQCMGLRHGQSVVFAGAVARLQLNATSDSTCNDSIRAASTSRPRRRVVGPVKEETGINSADAETSVGASSSNEIGAIKKEIPAKSNHITESIQGLETRNRSSVFLPSESSLLWLQRRRQTIEDTTRCAAFLASAAVRSRHASRRGLGAQDTPEEIRMRAQRPLRANDFECHDYEYEEGFAPQLEQIPSFGFSGASKTTRLALAAAADAKLSDDDGDCGNGLLDPAASPDRHLHHSGGGQTKLEFRKASCLPSTCSELSTIPEDSKRLIVDARTIPNWFKIGVHRPPPHNTAATARNSAVATVVERLRNFLTNRAKQVQPGVVLPPGILPGDVNFLQTRSVNAVDAKESLPSRIVPQTYAAPPSNGPSTSRLGVPDATIESRSANQAGEVSAKAPTTAAATPTIVSAVENTAAAAAVSEQKPLWNRISGDTRTALLALVSCKSSRFDTAIGTLAMKQNEAPNDSSPNLMFPENPAKQSRYEAFCQALENQIPAGVALEAQRGLSAAEQRAERSEFGHAYRNFRKENPHSSVVTTTAVTELRSGQKPVAGAAVSSGRQGGRPVVYNWKPSSLLCQRLGVPDPWAKKEFVQNMPGAEKLPERSRSGSSSSKQRSSAQFVDTVVELLGGVPGKESRGQPNNGPGDSRPPDIVSDLVVVASQAPESDIFKSVFGTAEDDVDNEDDANW